MSAALVISEASEFATQLGVSLEAVQLCRESEVIDLHLDTFIPVRLWGYDPFERHGLGVFRGRFFGHLDLPRAEDAGLSGGMWSITTNPFRRASVRWKAFEKNLSKLLALADDSKGRIQVASTPKAYQEARAAGSHAMIPAVQGGNAFDAGSVLDLPRQAITRVTVVHMTHSNLGSTSTPIPRLGGARGLTDSGRSFVEQLDSERIFVDLAHIHPKGFWDAVEVHDKSLPLIDTHTGVKGVTPHWRNLDDDQLKAVADTGGVIGIIWSEMFLKKHNPSRGAQMVVEHMQHIIDTVGEDHVAIGSDYDGAINPPADLRSGDSYPRLVQAMLDRGWSSERIQKALGLNFLRSWERIR